MLSRSSSAYQPLEAGSGNMAADFEDDSHEMTSIAVISNNPFRQQQHSTTASIERNGAVRTSTNNNNNHKDFDHFTVCRSSSEKTQWTNFHFVMCIGIVGFFVFWILLLGKMYLPKDFSFESIFPFFYSSSSSSFSSNVTSSLSSSPSSSSASDSIGDALNDT